MTTLVGKGSIDRSVTIVIPTRFGQLDTRFVGPLLLMRPPLNARREILFSSGMEVAEAYNALIAAALERDTAFIMTLEDDNLVTETTLSTLVNTIGNFDAISALYHAKDAGRTPLVFGVDLLPQVVQGQQTGVVPCVGIPFGCALWRTDLFRALPSPWFQTVETGSERWTHDLNFARRYGEIGKQVAVNCDVRVGHIDYRTGVVY